MRFVFSNIKSCLPLRHFLNPNVESSPCLIKKSFCEVSGIFRLTSDFSWVFFNHQFGRLRMEQIQDLAQEVPCHLETLSADVPWRLDWMVDWRARAQGLGFFKRSSKITIFVNFCFRVLCNNEHHLHAPVRWRLTLSLFKEANSCTAKFWDLFFPNFGWGSSQKRTSWLIKDIHLPKIRSQFKHRI